MDRPDTNPSRPSARFGVGTLAPVLFSVLVTYLGAYAVARSQSWIVHFSYTEPGSGVITGHEVTQGRASGEIGGAEGLVPSAIATSHAASSLWVGGFIHAHRVFTPLTSIETAVWYVCEPHGTPWH